MKKLKIKLVKKQFCFKQKVKKTNTILVLGMRKWEFCSRLIKNEKDKEKFSMFSKNSVSSSKDKERNIKFFMFSKNLIKKSNYCENIIKCEP